MKLTNAAMVNVLVFVVERKLFLLLLLLPFRRGGLQFVVDVFVFVVVVDDDFIALLRVDVVDVVDDVAAADAAVAVAVLFIRFIIRLSALQTD